MSGRTKRCRQRLKTSLAQVVVMVAVGLSIEPVTGTDHCPAGWHASSDTSPCYFIKDMDMTNEQSKTYCQGKLASRPHFQGPNDADDLCFKVRASSQDDKYWVGITRDNTQTSSFMWDNGNPLDNSSPLWKPGHPKSDKHCVFLDISSSVCELESEACDSKQSVICQRPAGVTDDCPADWLMYETSCLLFENHNKKKYNQARSICTGHGGTLVIMREEAKFNFVLDLINVFQNEPYWIGFDFLNELWADNDGNTEYTPLLEGDHDYSSTTMGKDPGEWKAEAPGSSHSYICEKCAVSCSAGGQSTTEPITTYTQTTSDAITVSTGVTTTHTQPTSDAITVSTGPTTAHTQRTSDAITVPTTEVSTLPTTAASTVSNTGATSHTTNDNIPTEAATHSRTPGASSTVDLSLNTVDLHFPQTVQALQPKCSIDTETDEGYRMRMLFEEGLEIFISCKEGFQVIGNDRAECVDGKWNPEIQMTSCRDIDECRENSLHCGGINTQINTQKVCVNTEGGFTCDCDDGYRLDRDSDLCLPQLNEEDEYEAKMCSPNSLSQARITCEAETVEGVTWNKTQANCSSPWIPCPGSSYGIMKRKCDVDGTWLAPDTTECTSTLLHEKLQDVSSINTTEAANDHMGGIDEFLDERKDAIYGGDLRLSAQILIEIANLGAVEFPAVPEEKSQFVDFFLEIASKLLDGGKEDMWKNIHLRKGYDSGVLVIFEAIETFGRSMAKQSDITAASTKNIGMKIELISSNRMSKRSVENSENACNSTCLILPSYLLHRNASDDLIVVTFKYRNPADLIVPPESVGTGRKVETRTWVDTITATKIVKRVNTEVISVSMFDNGGAIKELDEPITIEFEPKELGYGAKCSYMQYGDSSGVWKTDGCTHVQTSGAEVTCKCDHLTNFAVVMAIGKEPVPFVLEARYGILLATDYIAIILMVITLITIWLSRLLRDRYFVLGNMASSFILLPLSVVLNLSSTTEGSSCTIIEFLWHVALLGNFIWMAFYSVQQFIKLKFYVLSNRKYKLIYAVIGWIVPMVYSMFWVIFESQNRGENSCLHTIGTGNLTLLGPAAALVIIVVTLTLLRLSFSYFDTVLDKYDPIEIEQIWEETHCGMFLVMSMMGTWMFQFVYIVTDSLLSGYLYAGAILTEGSTVFLAVFATNHELLQSARVKLFGDEEEREALGELRETEDIRNAMRKDIDTEITTRKKRIEDTLRMKAMKEKQRADVIVNAFSLATRSVSRQQHRQVAPVEEVF